MSPSRVRVAIASLAVCAGLAVPAQAVVPPQGSPLLEKSFRHPALYIPNLHRAPSRLPSGLSAGLATELSALGVRAGSGFYDVRAGRWGSLILAQPLVPGTGAGNRLSWVQLAGRPISDAEMGPHAWRALQSWLAAHAAQLRLDLRELDGSPRMGVHERGELIQIYAQRVVGGVPVRDSSLKAVLNHGNLVLLSLTNWGDIDAPLAPSIDARAARGVAEAHLRPFVVSAGGREPKLELIPTAVGFEMATLVPGQGYRYRLAWVLDLRVQGDLGTWEALVDARSGELLAFQDRNQYGTKKAVGGIYPVSNDQTPPDGTEQAQFPMPYANISFGPGFIGARFANGAGVAGCVPGPIRTTLAGRYVAVNDVCGLIDEQTSSAALDVLDLGVGPTPTATDCEIPDPSHSAGDTKSSRTCFYETNRIVEQARGYLPDNTWLHQQLPANVNIDDECNAFWNGSSINFYRDRGSDCRNTGEIAAVFDHEWGHGMDNNGVNPNISAPGEAIADIHAFLRLKDSCVGRGFSKTGPCDGGGDPCTTCTGVRELDFAKHESGEPHDIAWVLTPTVVPGGGCVGIPGTQFGPCNQETHCEGVVPAEAGWDLFARDFQAAPFNYSSDTALELTTRLMYLGSQEIGSWYQCFGGPVPTDGDGCNADSGYLNVLAADDDNGDLDDGTPHMEAIFGAFDRHGIACDTPTVQNSGCASGPTEAPTVTGTAIDQGAVLSWGAVAGAARYDVYRTEGVHGCNFGKVKVGQTTDTTFTDSDLANGVTYFYTVVPVGSNAACLGLMSACTPVTPVPGANLTVPEGAQLAITGGDGDSFLDNCELGTLTFTVENNGAVPLSNVRLVSVLPLTHPTSVVETPLPLVIAANLAPCAAASASFNVLPQGLAYDATTEFQVVVTADQLGGATRTQVLRVGHVESNFEARASSTFSFETDLEGWVVNRGTFTRQTAGGGGGGTATHLSSSEAVDNACDTIRSPLLRLQSSSTLSLFTRYATESPVPTPYDRANAALVDADTDVRTVIKPTGGRTYDIPNPAPNGACVTGGQAGWAGANPSFTESTWTSAAFHDNGALVGKKVALEMAYGTDPLVSGTGFDFDHVAITNFELQIPDAQSDTCPADRLVPIALLVDDNGNAVMQPDEAVLMNPRWRNVGLDALTGVGGTLSSFVGPGSATYNVLDGVASYGNIAQAAVGDCLDAGNCYSLRVETSGSRPVPHWDAAVLETLTSSDDKTWTLHVGDSFSDVPATNGFYAQIETMLHLSVTSGCGLSGSQLLYCPAASTSREQMSKFVLKAKEDPAYVPPACQPADARLFTDVPASNGFCPWIEELSRRGVVNGCGVDPPRYCPADFVTREQMAKFVLKTLEPTLEPPPCVESETRLFADVPASNGFCKFIEELARRGVVSGCAAAPPRYCPAEFVTREQMSKFLVGTFSLKLYAP